MLRKNSATLENRQAELDILRRKKPIKIDFKKDKIGSSISDQIQISESKLDIVIDEWFASGSVIFLNGMVLETLLADFQPLQDRKRFLENLWRTHLLQAIPSESQKAAYVKILFKYAHSAGLHDALNRAHNKHLRDYTGKSEGVENPVIYNYSVAKGILQFTDISVITALVPVAEDDREEVIEDSSEDRTLILYEMETRYEFPFDIDNVVRRTVTFQQDTIYNTEAFEILLRPASELVAYAFQYIENKGHIKAFSEMLLGREDLPGIAEYNTVKDNYYSLIPGKAEWHQNADKIFSYIAENFPSFVEKLLAEYELAQENEEEFVYYLKLLHRLSKTGMPSLVDRALELYSRPILSHEKKLSVTTYNEANYRSIYRLCKTKHYFRISKTATEIIESATKAINIYIQSKVVKLEATESRNWLSTTIWGYAESRGVCRAHAYLELLQTASDDVAKCAIIICILKDSSTKVLKQTVLEEIRPHNVDTMHDFFPWMPEEAQQFQPQFHKQFIDPLIAATNKIKTFSAGSIPQELSALITNLDAYFSDNLNFMVLR